jgi:hypothetical protein
VKRRLLAAISLVAVIQAGCATPQTPVSPAAMISATALPAGARPDLNRQRWISANGFVWPPDDGFAATPVLTVLPAGVLLDRFGSDTGNFFSPAGALYSKRALPYVCEQQAYTVFRVRQPLPVWAGRAAPWFDEPGGATQFQTDANATRLVRDAVIVPIIRDAAGVDAPDRPCGPR